MFFLNKIKQANLISNNIFYEHDFRYKNIHTQRLSKDLISLSLNIKAFDRKLKERQLI